MINIHALVRSISPFLCAAGTVLAATVPTHAAAQEAIRFAVGVDPAYSPVFLAKTAGIFKREGLNVNVVQYAQGGEGVDGVIAGQNQFVGATESTTINRSTRGDLVALAVFSQSAKFIKLVVRPGITDVSQVRKLGIVPGSVNEFATQKLIEKYAINPASVSFVRAGPPEFPALLQRGDVDGYVMWEPWPTNGVKAGGKILAVSGDFGYTYNLLIAASGAWVKAHPKEAKGVVNAIAEACSMITSDPAQAGSATQSEAKIPAAQTVELLKDVQCKVRDFTASDVETYKAIAAFQLDRKLVPALPDFDKILVRGFAEEK